MSTLSRKIGLQFLILLSLSFLSINFIIAGLCEVHSSYLPNECKVHDKIVFFTSDQNVLKNSLVRPSFPGDLSLGILFKASNSYFSVMHLSCSRDCSADN